MSEFFNEEKVRDAINAGMTQAQDLLEDPGRIDGMLKALEVKLAEVPVAGTVLADVPLMVSMVKSYAAKSYTAVSPKVIVTMVSAFLYMLKRKDLIDDRIPVLGKLDDIAVLAFALKYVEPELKAYAAWRDAPHQA